MVRSFGGFSISRRPIGVSGICLAIVGEVDLANTSELLVHFKAVAANDRHLIVESSGLRYIDSSGIRVLVES